MAISQSQGKRKATGGRYKKQTKKLKNKGNLPIHTTIGETRRRTNTGRSKITKKHLLQANLANVYDPKSKKYSKAKIESVVESPSNRNFVRRNIMTKGSIIKTDKGNAKIISRPGQEGTINAILI